MPIPLRCRAFSRALILILGCALVAPVPALAAEPARLSERWDEKRAASLLERAVRHVQAKGEAALVDFSRQGDFVDRDLYVYVLAGDGRFLASGGSSAALIGQNVIDRPDATGKRFFREMIERARADGGGRVEYRWLNPAEDREEPKVTLFRKVGDFIVAVGFYAPRATAAQAQQMLDRAAAALAGDAAAALAEFQAVGGRFMQDDLYVFVVDPADGRFLAHGTSPGLVGRDGRELRDPRGKPIINDMLNVARRKGSGELDYVWRNPTTGKVESKHSYFRVVEGKLVGVGYYTR